MTPPGTETTATEAAETTATRTPATRTTATAAAGGTLDPDDWEELRALGHRMVDDVLDLHRTVREGPVWQRVPDEVVGRLSGPAPRVGLGAEAAFERFREWIRPYPLGNIHPRFWGWVIGSGSPLGALSELLAAGLNPNMSGLRNAGVHVERQVIGWLKELLGFPESGTGTLVSGGSMANTLGVGIGMHAKAEIDLALEGLRAVPRPMILYTSTQTHYSVQKTASLLGLGHANLRLIPVDGEFRIDLGALEETIAADRAAGLRPFGIVGNAGTVNTGAFDDLEALADIAAREDLWLHVDGAFGAFAVWDPRVKPLAAGLERADSLAFDLHKWMCVPIECGCVVVRDGEDHRRPFAVEADYLTPMTRGVAESGGEFADLGPQLSRSFRALKVWMLLQAHGAEAFAQVVRDNVDQARHLDALVHAHPELESLAPTPLNVVCFRYFGAGVGPGDLDELNRELVMELHESGVAVPSYTMLDGDFAIRVAITNHRTRTEDLDLLVDEVVRRGRALADR